MIAKMLCHMFSAVYQPFPRLVDKKCYSESSSDLKLDLARPRSLV